VILTAAGSVPLVDADTHLVEPADLWTSRVPKKYVDAVPHVEIEPTTGHSHWRIGDTWIWPVGHWGQAGWKTYPPMCPWEYEDVQPASYDSTHRLRLLDEYGIDVQIIYPNMIGFQAPKFEALGPELSVLCTQAYNDFLLEWSSADSRRLISIAMLPYWDRDACVIEMERCIELGHKGVLFANKFERVDLPGFCEPYWDPVYAAAEAMNIPINYHIGFANPDLAERTSKTSLAESRESGPEMRPRKALGAASLLMAQCDVLGTLLTSGLCQRFPNLKLVSVESSFGQIPFYLEALDWHWKAFGNSAASLLPSEYFTRQCYGTLWFERTTLELLKNYPDNFMFSTDYPHPTSLSPGPTSPAALPRDHIAEGYAGLDPELVAKVICHNARNVYGLDV
jgi:predicted TIM-barrel fold metal-dependent hydrolase